MLAMFSLLDCFGWLQYVLFIAPKLVSWRRHGNNWVNISIVNNSEISTLDSNNPIKAYKYIGVDIEVVDNGCSEAFKETEVDVNRAKESPSCERDLICNVKSLPSSSGGTDGDFKSLELKLDVGLEFLEGEKGNKM